MVLDALGKRDPQGYAGSIPAVGVCHQRWHSRNWRGEMIVRFRALQNLRDFDSHQKSIKDF